MPIIGPPPALTTAQRNALTQANRQKGTVIFNTDFGRLEVNAGTDIAPTWQILSGESHGTALPATGLYNGYRFTYFTSNKAWELIYRSDLDATYPWHFIGGAPLHSNAAAAVGSVSCGITVPRNGTYFQQAHMSVHTNSQDSPIDVRFNWNGSDAGTISNINWSSSIGQGISMYASASGSREATIASGQVIGIRAVFTNGTAGSVQQAFNEVWPVKIA